MKELISKYGTREYAIKIVFAICAFFLEYIDVIRNTGNGADWATAINCIGFCIFPMIVIRYKLKDFLKIPYYVWTAIFLIAAYPAYLHFRPDTDYRTQTLTAIINIGLYGIIVIRLIYQFIESKSWGPNKVTLFFFIWLFAMGWAVISVNKQVWPIWFLVMFMAYYLAPTDNQTIDWMFSGFIEGLIIAFFVVQSLAFLHRPFDTARYKGLYFNCNINSMFYASTLAACLAKLSILRRKGANKVYRVIFFIFTFALWDFNIFTVSRIGIVTFFVLTLIYLILDEILIFKGGFIGFIKRGLLIVLVAVLMFLPVYGCIRYIPGLRHHPVWFSDYDEEKSVFSWDPIDSPKYTSLSKFYNTLIGRFDDAIEQTKDKDDSGDLVSSEITDENADYSYPGSSPQNPYTKKIVYDTPLKKILGIRYYIYSYQLSRLNFLGHKDSVAGGWISKSYNNGHAHNSYLELGYWFGIPHMLGIITLILSISICTFRRFRKKTEELSLSNIYGLYVIILFGVLSLFETCCFPGEMPLTLLMLGLLPFVTERTNS